MARSRILILACVMALIVAPCTGMAESASAADTVDFTVSVPELGLIGGFAADVEYPMEMQVTKGDLAEISYSLSAASGSFTINIPLSMITFGFLDDQSVTIPLPQTPIGEMPISVLQYLAQIPSGLASVDIVLQGAVAAKTITCSSGQTDVLTSTSSLLWTSWGTKGVQVQTHAENPSVTVSTRFAYTLGIGIDVTFLGFEYTLIEPIEFSAVSGTPVTSTTIVAVDPFPTALLVIGVICAAAVIGGLYFYSRSKKGMSMPPSIGPLQQYQMPTQNMPQQYPPVQSQAFQFQSGTPPAPPVHYLQQSAPVQSQMQEIRLCPYCRRPVQAGWLICGYCGGRFG